MALLPFANTPSQKSSYTPATKVIAPVGYPHKVDYSTDGVADDVQVQAAYDALNILGGGVIKLVGYSSSTPLVLNTGVTLYSNTTLQGEGIGITIVKIGSFNTDAFHIGSNLGTNSGHNPPGTFNNINFY